MVDEEGNFKNSLVEFSLNSPLPQSLDFVQVGGRVDVTCIVSPSNPQFNVLRTSQQERALQLSFHNVATVEYLAVFTGETAQDSCFGSFPN